MYTMILLLYLQQNLGVTLDHADVRGRYASAAACEAAALKLRGPVPVPRNYAAAWHDVLCIPIDRDVAVNDMHPLDLAAALRAYAPLHCQADGTWERVAALCSGADTAAQCAPASRAAGQAAVGAAGGEKASARR